MLKTGYALIDSNNNIVKSFHDTTIDANGRPMLYFIIPNTTDTVHTPAVGEKFNNYIFVEKWSNENNPPSKWHLRLQDSITRDNNKIIISSVYESFPSLVPQNVSPLQFRRALRASNLHSKVISFINTLSEEQKEQFEYTSIIPREHDLIIVGIRRFNLTKEDIDNLFRLADSF